MLLSNLKAHNTHVCPEPVNQGVSAPWTRCPSISGHSHTHAYTHTHLFTHYRQLDMTINLQHMSLDEWRKPENPDEKHLGHRENM